jgi:hypothetical protein
MSTRIFIALKFWFPRPWELGKIILSRKVDSRIMAKYEMQKAEKLRTHLIKEFARR